MFKAGQYSSLRGIIKIKADLEIIPLGLTVHAFMFTRVNACNMCSCVLYVEIYEGNSDSSYPSFIWFVAKQICYCKTIVEFDENSRVPFQRSPPIRSAMHNAKEFSD